MTLTIGSGLMGKPKNRDDRPPLRDPRKPVLPEEPPARMKVIQKYKKGPGGKMVPEDHVFITFNHIGQGRGGRFKVPRVWLETAWKSLQ